MKRTTFVILCLEGAVLSFNVAACSAIIPSISKAFGIAQFQAGPIVWLYMLAYGVSALFYGPLVRVFDAKKIELFCFLLFSFSNLLAAFSGNLKILLTARFFMGVFGASVIPLVLILIANHTETKNRGRLIGVFFSATFVASLLGLFLSGIISWRLIFLIPAIFGFVLLGCMYFYGMGKYTLTGTSKTLSQPLKLHKEVLNLPTKLADEVSCLPNFAPASEGPRINYLSVLKDKSVVAIFTYIFLISLFYHGVQQWLAVYFSSQFQFSQFLVSMLIILTSLSGIFGEVIGGYLSDKIGRLKTVNFGIMFMILAVFSLLIKMPVVGLALVMMIWGLGWTFNHVSLSVMLTDLPKEFLNEAASLNSGVRFLSGGIGAVLSGIVMQKSFNMGFLIFGLCLIILVLFTKNILGGVDCYPPQR